ncbi:MAG: transglutaminase domain-containing protein [Oscillospiraceae bacterium]
MKRNRLISVIVAFSMCLSSTIITASADDRTDVEIPKITSVKDIPITVTKSDDFSDDLYSSITNNIEENNTDYPDVINQISYVSDDYVKAMKQTLKQETGSEFGFAGTELNLSSDDTNAPSIGNDRVYSTNYYYDRLNQKQKELWDEIDAACYSFYYDTSSLDPTDPCFAIVNFSKKNLTMAEVSQTYWCYYYSHPEYFFLWNGIAASDTDIILRTHYVFSAGDVRKEAREHIAQLTEKWMSEIEDMSTQAEKEIHIAKLIADNVVYHKKNGEPVSNDENQSLAGALYYGTCVCTGYAMAMTYMCNAAGIECITLVSDTHAWNRVKLDGVWYEADPQGFDGMDRYFYYCLNTSTADILSSAHTVNNTLTSPTSIALPQCTAKYDYTENAYYAAAGDQCVKIVWPLAEGTTLYKVIIQENAFSQVTWGPTTENQMVFTHFFGSETLKNGTPYTFIVCLCDDSGTIVSYYTPTLTIAPIAVPAVSGLTAEPGPCSVTLSWDAVPDTDKYFIYRYDEESAQYTHITDGIIRTNSTKDTSITIYGLDPDKEYKYAVRSCDEYELEASSYSEFITVSPLDKGYIRIDTSVSPSSAGTVTLSKTSAKPGEKINITASPADGYVFKEWQCSDPSVVISNKTSASAELTADSSNIQLNAVFAPVCYAPENKLAEGVSFDVYVSAKGTYTWQKLSNGKWVNTGCTDSRFTVSEISDSGQYRCLVKDDENYTAESTTVDICVVPAAEVTIDMISDYTIEQYTEFVNFVVEQSADLNVFILTDAQLYAIEKVLEKDRY